MPARGMGEWERVRMWSVSVPLCCSDWKRNWVEHRERCRWGEDIAEDIAICFWRHRVDAIGGCCSNWGATAYRSMSVVWDKSMNKGLISEDRGNKATLLLTIPCSLLSRLQRIYRSQYLDWNLVWRWAEAYCCTCDRESGNHHRDLAWIPA